MPAPAPLAALLALAVARAAAEIHEAHYTAHTKYPQYERSVRNIGSPSGCQYEGRWYREGAPVPVAAREACLRCACGRGALSCARRACAAPPDPLPRRCYLRHRKGACCPELHCPEGVTTLEQSASARFESEETVSGAGAGGHACVEGGVVYAAGSAMGGRVACETCFCLAGARRCVRPRCLPPPAACSARPAPGACCPARYYCDAPAHPPSTEPPAHRSHDCLVDGAWVREGEPVAGGAANCSACFCLRGAVRCQPLACAPPLHGCEPLLRAGQCCPHQYHCPPRGRDRVIVSHDDRLTSHNSLTVTRADDRSFHSAAPSTHPPHSPPAAAAAAGAAGPTTKVKRKTSESPPPATSTMAKTKKDITKPTSISTQTIKHTTPAETVATTETLSIEKLSTITENEQPEGTAKIMINGTINCTAELSSSPDGISANASRPPAPPAAPAPAPSPTPPPAAAPQPYTSNPNEIITDSIIGSVFDENETFTINVTSSLRTNVSRPVVTPARPARPAAAPPPQPPAHVNATNRVKGDYDYDYTEPTLPPSLPNLKIIPFVAADAVVDEEAPSKDVLTFPIMDREDKFPVYYPMIETKQTTANRREDVYSPTHYPVFVSSKAKVPASAPAPAPAPPRPAPPPPPPEPAARPADSNLKLDPPAINMFSPPVETEGGFVPKGPGLIDEYYAVYPSTHSPPSLPHLTTSMQLNTVKGECVTADGRRVSEGAALDVSCARCACAWGELRCAPRACPAAACRERGALSANLDPCCPETICIQHNTTTVAPTSTTTVQSTQLESKEPLTLQSEILLFDPPPDRSAPPEPPTTERAVKIETTKYSTVPSIYIDNIELTTTKTSANPTAAAAHTEPPATPDHSAYADNATSAEDYEEEEEDEGFSFGSVLKLLLSESYDPTSPAPPKKSTTAPARITTAAVTTTITAPTTTKATTTTARPPRPPIRPPVTAARPPSTTIRTRPVKPSVAPFIPLPHRFDTVTHKPYIPPKKTFSPHTTVNKIDHLVLGEATAIKKSTPRPSGTASRPGGPPRPARDPPPPATVAPPAPAAAPTPAAAPAPAASQPAAAAGAPGLLKLAGCNIYGRMYRVGRIIAELSSPCQECRCTELGVHCRPLRC